MESIENQGEILYIDSSDAQINKAERNPLCLNFQIKNAQPTQYMLQLSLQDSPKDQPKQIGYTAPQNPDKKQMLYVNVSFIIDYFFQRNQILFIELARQGSSNINASVPIAQVLGSNKSEYDVTFPDNQEVLTIMAKSMTDNDEHFKIDLEVLNTSANFYYVLKKKKCFSEGKKEYFGVYKSPLQQKGSSFTIPGKYLDYGDHNQPILIEIYVDDRKNGQKEVTINGLFQNSKYLIGDFNFEIKIEKIEKKEKSFVGLVNENLQIGLSVAIDFTGSNGNPKNPSSLHFISPTPNQYESAIKACGDILSYYDSDKIYPVYGFGANINKKLSHCFALNIDSGDPNIKGMDNVLETYKKTVSRITFSGPTFFHVFLENMFKTIRADTNPMNYNIILILTDGAINDMNDTVNTIVDGSDLPVSIIIVGIGSFNFNAMRVLDSDNQKLKTKEGKAAVRDIVQFVTYNEVKNDPTALAEKVLEEVPAQIESYFKLKNH